MAVKTQSQIGADSIRPSIRRGRVQRLGPLVAVAGLVMTAIPLHGARVEAAPKPTGGSITVNVFHDYNADGSRNTVSTSARPAIDDLVAGATLTATCLTNNGADSADGTGDGETYAAPVTATDNSNGTYAFTGLPGTPCRVEATALPAGYQPAPLGTDNGGLLQFAAAGSTVTMAVHRPAEFCQNNPRLVTPCYVAGDVEEPLVADKPAIKSITYDSGTDPTPAVPADYADVGTTWGMAYQRSSRTLFAAAYLRRFADLGPNGTGAIYRLAPGGDGLAGTDDDVPSLFVDLNALLGPVAGTDPHPPSGTAFIEPMPDSNDWFHDANAFAVVGKVSLGDIDLSADGETMYVMNLADRRLYVLPIGSPAVAPPAGAVQSYAVPFPAGCPIADVRPFGVGVDAVTERVFIGMVCSAESSGLRSDLRGYVYEFTGAGFAGTATLDFSLDFPRAINDDGSDETWFPWKSDAIPNTGNTVIGGADAYHPEPMFSDIQFDGGDMILGFRDRYADQMGWRIGSLDVNDIGTLQLSVAIGDIYRACAAGSGWSLESNGTCGAFTTVGDDNQRGPGGGEYYWADSLAGTNGEDETDADGTCSYHCNLGLGGIAQLPGAPDMVTTFSDATEIDSNGLRWFNNATGASPRGALIYYGPNDDPAGLGTFFDKSSGLGDLEILCDMAPVEIGNRVWKDANHNGVQDPGEPALAGVPVTLTVGTSTFVATTDGSGSYRFSSDARSTSTASSRFGITQLQPGAQFQLSVPLTVASSLATLSLSAPDIGTNDAIDSDASAAGATALMTVGAAGSNNHTYDFGYHPPLTVSLGNQVWFDTDNDGVLDAGELPAAGVVVHLLADSNNDGVPDSTTPVATRTTDSSGLYLFESLTPGATFVVGVAPSNFSGGGTLVGYWSSGTTAAANGSATESAPTDPDDDVDNDDSGARQSSGAFAGYVLSRSITLVAGSEPTGETPAGPTQTSTARDADSNVTVDFGFYTVSVGDLVWRDQQTGTDTGYDNGVLDAGEAGLSGVTVRLLGSDNTVLATTTTDGSGAYGFPGLPAGSYRVEVVLPSATRSSTDATDSATPLATDSDDNGVGTGGGTLTSATFSAAAGSALGTVNAASGATEFDRVDFGLVDEFDLTVDKAVTSSGAYFVGTAVTYTLSVSNLGPGRARDGFTVTDRLPAGLSFASSPVTVGTQWSCAPPAGQVLTCTWIGATAGTGNDTLVGASSTPTITVHAVVASELSATVLTNEAVVRPSAGDPSETIPVGTANDGYETGDSTVGSNNDDSVAITTATYDVVSLGNQVWFDADNDGALDSGELPVAGVIVHLFVDADNDGVPDSTTPTATATTDASGSYLFENLPTGGTYVVGVAPSNFTGSGALVGYWSSGTTAAVDGSATEVAPTDPDDNVDNDDSGARQSGGAFAGYVLSRSTTLDAGSEPTGETPGGPTAASTARDSDSNLTVDFGFYSISIGNLAWHDQQAGTDAGYDNGVLDAGEVGLAGVTVRLLASDGTVLATTTTDGSGVYSFPGLPAGSYQVHVVLPAGTRSSSDATSSGTPLTIDSDDNATGTGSGTATSPVFVVAAGDSSHGTVSPTTGATSFPRVDFGVVDAIDLSVDKSVTSAGPYYVGTAVTYTLTVANLGPGRAHDGFMVTDRLPTGLVFAATTTTVDAAWSCAAPAGQLVTCTWIGATAGTGNDTLAALASTSTITIHAVVGSVASAVALTNEAVVRPSSSDAAEVNPVGTANGGYETGDPTAGSNNDDSAAITTATYDLALAKVVSPSSRITAQGDQVTWIIRVQNQGSVPSGAFTVVDQLPAGMTFVSCSNDCTVVGSVVTWTNPAALAAGQSIDLSLVASVSDVRMTPFRNWAEITSDSGPDDDSTPDSNTGNGATMPNDGYVGVTDLASLGTDGPQGSEPTGSTDSDDNDDGLIASIVVAVGDFVWHDRDHDGIQDADEAAIAGVRVALLNPDGTQATDANGVPVAPVVTDSAGHYVFDNLLPGSYRIVFSNLPTDYEFTAQGSGGATDSNPAANGETPVFALTAGIGGGMRTPVAADGVAAAAFVDPTIDAGIWNPLIDVAPVPPTPPTTAPLPELPLPSIPAELPRTGSDPLGSLVLALGLLIVGALTITASRTRRRPS